MVGPAISPEQLVSAEQAAIAAGGAGCGYRCACHGNVLCLRLVHPDEADNQVPHLGRDEGGDLVQWTGPCADPVDVPTT
jgi:hypothetical protein